MSNRSKREYLEALYSRYHAAGGEEKSRMLDEFCRVCEYNRKYAIRLLNAPIESRNPSRPVGRKPRYHTPEVKRVLQHLSVASNLVCSKRLKALLPTWLPHYPEPIGEETRMLLEEISASSIDRVLADWRGRCGKLGLSTTKPGSLLRKQIPVQTGQWDESRPGFLEADTVAHCGSSMAGSFIYTVNLVDIATGWSAFGAVWGRGQRGVYQILEGIEQSLPFRILGFDSDNGSEFLNWHLYDYFTKRKRPVAYTRSRPYQSNDNAHIEQKNWSNIRGYLGYQRFEDEQMVPLLNDLYQNELPLLVNFFLPSFKLLEKRREGTQIIKRHDSPRTPFERLCESATLTRAKKRTMLHLYASLNPFELQRHIKLKVTRILQLATPLQ